MADQSTKKEQHPGDNNSSTCAGLKKKNGQRSEEGDR